MKVRYVSDRSIFLILFTAAVVAAACVTLVAVIDFPSKRPSNPRIVGPAPEMKEINAAPPLRLTVPADIPVLGPPIPQDAERQIARRRRIRERYETQMLSAYETAGRRDPRWDADARTALRGLVEAMCGHATPIYIHHQRTAGESARMAVGKGCTDPFIRYIAVRFPFDFEEALQQRQSAPEVRGLYKGLLADMRASRYPPACKAAVFADAATALTYAGPSATNEVKDLLDDCLEQTALLLDVKSDLARDEVFTQCVHVARIGRWLAEDREVWYRQASAALGDRPSADVVRHLLTGDYSIHAAWDARGSGLANTVTPEGWRLFRERLEKAEEAFEAALAADPTCKWAPIGMLTVCKGLGYDRETMERWFRRAMEVDGDSLTACERKTDFLLPKWGGSVEEVVSFARQCRDTGNWEGSLPLVLADAHKWLAQDSGNKRDYYKQPVVRADLESVYRPLLMRFPNALSARTDFFLLGVEGGWPEPARENLAAMIADPWKPAFRNGPDHGAQIHWAKQH